MERYFDEVEEVLDTLLKQKDRPIKPKKHFSASGAGQCMRRLILGRLGAKATPLTAKQRRIFWLGDVIHEALMSRLNATGRILHTEEYVSDFGDPIVGRIDFIWQANDGKSVLYDLKTTRTGVFWSKIARATEAPEDNVFQLITYFITNKKFKIDRIKLIYISKEDGAMKSFTVEITEELVEKVKVWWKQVHSYLDKQKLPMVQPTEELQKRYYCGFCSYSSFYCFPSDTVPQSILDSNVKELDWSTEIEKQVEKKS